MISHYYIVNKSYVAAWRLEAMLSAMTKTRSTSMSSQVTQSRDRQAMRMQLVGSRAEPDSTRGDPMREWCHIDLSN